MINKHSLKTDYKKNTILPKFLKKIGQLLLQDMNSINGLERKKLSFFKGIRLPIVIEKIGNFVLAKLPESFLEPFSEYLYHKTSKLCEQVNEKYKLLGEKKAGVDYTHIFTDKDNIKVTSALGVLPYNSSIPTTILTVNFDEIKIEDNYPYLIIKSEKIAEFIKQKNIYSEKGGIVIAPLVKSDFELVDKALSFGNLLTKLDHLKKEAKSFIKKADPPANRAQQVPRREIHLVDPNTTQVGGGAGSDIENALRLASRFLDAAAPFLGYARIGTPQAPRLLYIAVWKELREQWPDLVTQDANLLFNIVKNIGAIFSINVDPSLKDKIADSLEKGAWATYYPIIGQFLGLSTPSTFGFALTNALYNWMVSLDPNALDAKNAPQLANRIAVVARHVTADVFPLLQKYQLVSLTPNEFMEYIVALSTFMPEKLPDPRSTDPKMAAEIYSAFMKRNIPLVFLAASRGIRPDQLVKFIDQAGLRGADPVDIAVALGHAFGMGGVTGQGLTAIANSGPFRQLMHLKIMVDNNPHLLNNPYVRQVMEYYEIGRMAGSPMSMGLAPFPPPMLLSMALASVGVNPVIAANTPVPATALLKQIPYMKTLMPHFIASMSDMALPGTGGTILSLINTIYLDPELRQKIKNASNFAGVFYEAGARLGLPPAYIQGAIAGIGGVARELGTSPENVIYMLAISLSPALTPEETLRRIYFELSGRPRRSGIANFIQAMMTENIDPNAPLMHRLERSIPYFLGLYHGSEALSQRNPVEKFFEDLGLTTDNILYKRYIQPKVNEDEINRSEPDQKPDFKGIIDRMGLPMR